MLNLVTVLSLTTEVDASKGRWKITQAEMYDFLKLLGIEASVDEVRAALPGVIIRGEEDGDVYEGVRFLEDAEAVTDVAALVKAMLIKHIGNLKTFLEQSVSEEKEEPALIDMSTATFEDFRKFRTDARRYDATVKYDAAVMVAFFQLLNQLE